MNPESLQRVRRGVQLADAAVDQDQARQRSVFLLQPGVAPCHHFAHGGEIVVAVNRADDELAVVGLLHPAVFPHHHAGHLVGALDVRDVEALDALRRLGQLERILQRLLNRLRRTASARGNARRSCASRWFRPATAWLSSARAAACGSRPGARASPTGTPRARRRSSNSTGT